MRFNLTGKRIIRPPATSIEPTLPTKRAGLAARPVLSGLPVLKNRGDGLSLGKLWTKRNTPLDGIGSPNVQGMAASADRVIATPNGGKVIYSSDGIVWSETASVFSAAGPCAHGNGTFVTCEGSGGNSSAYTSTDGINWTTRTNAIPVAGNPRAAMAFGNGRFVVVGWQSDPNIGFCATSDDNGATWTQRTMPNGTWNDVVYGNGKFVAIAQNSFSQQFAYSTDGASWSLADTSGLGSVTGKAISYGMGKFVATNAGGNVRTSVDGINWSQASITGASPGNFHGKPIFGNGLCVIPSMSAASPSKQVHSSDLTSFAVTDVTGPLPGVYKWGVFFKGLFVLGENGGDPSENNVIHTAP